MYAQKKPIENVHIVRERDRRRFRELFSVVLLGVFVGGFLIVFTWQNLTVIRLGHEATRLQKQKSEIENANKALQLQLDHLTALGSVEQRASALGFERTDPRVVVMVERSTADAQLARAGEQPTPKPPARPNAARRPEGRR